LFVVVAFAFAAAAFVCTAFIPYLRSFALLFYSFFSTFFTAFCVFVLYLSTALFCEINYLWENVIGFGFPGCC